MKERRRKNRVEPGMMIPVIVGAIILIAVAVIFLTVIFFFA